jgi:hypothetical protein
MHQNGFYIPPECASDRQGFRPIGGFYQLLPCRIISRKAFDCGTELAQLAIDAIGKGDAVDLLAIGLP